MTKTTTTFVVAHPVLPSLNLARTVRFYEDRLGFTRYLFTDNVAVLGRGPVELHFWLCEDENIPANTSCRIQVTQIEGFYADCRAADLTEYPLEGSVEHMRVFGMSDPDGNLLWFFELKNARPDPTVYSS